MAGCNVCTDALIGSSYVVRHDTTGLLASVDVEVFVTTITSCEGDADLLQPVSNSVQFTPNTALGGGPSGNAIPRLKSGNPGYIAGKPILVGFLDSAGKATTNLNTLLYRDLPTTDT